MSVRASPLRRALSGAWEGLAVSGVWATRAPDHGHPAGTSLHAVFKPSHYKVAYT